MWMIADKMKTFGQSAINRLWKKVVIAILAGVLVIGLLAYSTRHSIIIWHLQANKQTQKMVLVQMLENAKPIIERELKMTLPQKIVSRVMGDRNEKTRQRDALDDIRTFVESGFENNGLCFKDVHKLTSINNFPLDGLEFALVWKRGDTQEVLVAFNIGFLKGEVDKMQVNEACCFFSELKSYIETKARKN
jgi:hypothetical protein